MLIEQTGYILLRFRAVFSQLSGMVEVLHLCVIHGDNQIVVCLPCARH